MEDAEVVLRQTLRYFGHTKNNTIKPATGTMHTVSGSNSKRCTQHFTNNALQVSQPNTQEILAVHDNGQVETVDGSLFTPLDGSIYKLTTSDYSDMGEGAKMYIKGSREIQFVLFLDSKKPIRSDDLNSLLYPTLQELAQRSEKMQPITPPQHTPATPQPSAVIN